MLILPQDIARARKLLQGVAAQRTHCTMVVFGDTERAREIASRGDVRAANHPYRNVVWAPNLKALETPEFAELVQAQKDGAEAAILRLDFKLVATLRGDDATSFIAIERAFINAALS